METNENQKASNISIENDENLVTDAIPDPPRVNNENSNIPVENDVPGKKSRTKPKKPKSHTTGAKPKTPPSHSIVYGNSINIIQASNIRIGNDIINHFPGKMDKMDTSETTSKTGPDVPLTKEIIKLLNSNESLTKDHLTLLSLHIGTEWKTVGQALGFSKGEINQFRINNESFDIDETIYQMLLRWTQMKPDDATVGNVCTILWDLNLKEVVKIFCNKKCDTEQ